MYTLNSLENSNDYSTQKKLNAFNPVFRLIEDLIKERSNILPNYRRYEKNQRTAYFFEIEDKQIHRVFSEEGFQCVDRHLSVDKFYNENERDLTCAHYTEKNVNSITKQERVVHIYFDLQARVVLIQVKDSVGKMLTISPIHEAKLKGNGQAALQMLKLLLDARAQRFKKALEASQELEKHLDERSKHLATQEGRAQYLAEAALFCDAVEGINRYSIREHDDRAMVVRQIIKILKAKDLKTAVLKDLEGESLASEMPTEDSDTTGKDETREVEEVTTQTKNKKKQKKSTFDFTQIRERSVAKFERLEKEFDATLNQPGLDARNLILLGTIVDKMRIVCLNLSLLKKGVEGAPLNAMRERLENKCKAFPNPLDKLKEFFFGGDLQNFQTLFAALGNRISFEGFHDFVTDVIQEQDNAKLQEKIKIMDYMFFHSENYRSFLSRYGSMYSMKNPNDIGETWLVSAARNNNLPVFELFLNQGCNPHVVGMALGVTGSTSTLRGVIFHTNITAFVERLLDHNVSIDEEGISNNEAQFLQKNSMISDLLKLGARNITRQKIRSLSHGRNTKNVERKQNFDLGELGSVMVADIKLDANHNVLGLEPVRADEIHNQIQEWDIFGKNKVYSLEEQKFIDNVLHSDWSLLVACKMQHYQFLPFLWEKTALEGLAVSMSYVLNHREELVANFVVGSVIASSDSFHEVRNSLISFRVSLNNPDQMQEFLPIQSVCKGLFRLANQDSSVVDLAVKKLKEKIKECEKDPSNSKSLENRCLYTYAILLLWVHKKDLTLSEANDLLETFKRLRLLKKISPSTLACDENTLFFNALNLAKRIAELEKDQEKLESNNNNTVVPLVFTSSTKATSVDATKEERRGSKLPF